MTHYFFSCLLCALSMVSPLHILTAILAGLTEVRHEADWVLLLNAFRTSRDVSFLLFVRTGSNQIRLSRPAVSPFLVELFQLQNNPSSKSLWQPQRLGPYAALPFSPYASVDPKISSSSLPLAARRIVCSLFLCLVRFGRSSRSCIFFLSTLFSRFCCCTTIGFSAFSLFLVIRAVILLVIDAYVHTPYTHLDHSFLFAY